MLTGERGHYELAAARDVRPLIRAMEGFATSTKLLPEQVWALPDLPKAHMGFGRPTGGAMPLVWAHAEYIQLVRSATDGQVFGLISEVADRYRNRRAAPPLEIWKFNRQVRSLPAGGTLRIQAASPFRLHWTCDEWQQAHDTDSTSIAPAMNMWTFECQRGRRPPFASLFSGRRRGTGKGGIFRSASMAEEIEPPVSTRREKQRPLCRHGDASADQTSSPLKTTYESSPD